MGLKIPPRRRTYSTSPSRKCCSRRGVSCPRSRSCPFSSRQPRASMAASHATTGSSTAEPDFSSVLPRRQSKPNSARISQCTRRVTMSTRRGSSESSFSSVSCSKASSHIMSRGVNTAAKSASPNVRRRSAVNPSRKASRGVSGSHCSRYWRMAARRLNRQVRAEKKPTRCEASCTLSEKARAFLSPLKREAKSWLRATLARLADCAPMSISELRAPQPGQSLVPTRKVFSPDLTWRRLTGTKTRMVSAPHCGHFGSFGSSSRQWLQRRRNCPSMPLSWKSSASPGKRKMTSRLTLSAKNLG